jgi:PAS domain S-box-containing protein
VSWITILWPMMAAACITLALMQLLVWVRMPSRHAPLLFAIAALCVAAIAGIELGMMRAATAGEFGALQRWTHLPGFVLVVSLVFFVRVYFGAGRPWLAWTVCGLRLVVVVVNFLSDVSVNLKEITALRQVPVWGEMVSVAEGVVNPWSRLATLSLLALVVFVVDAAISVWRRGGEARRRATLVGASLALAVTLIMVRNFLIHEGFLQAPYLISASYMVVIAAMAYELGSDIHRSAQLARELQESDTQLRESEQRFRLVVEEAPNSMVMVDRNGTIALVNAMTEKVFGYRRDELVGRPVEMLIPERIRGDHASHRGRYAAEPGPRAMGANRDVYGRHKDGHDILLEVGLNPIRTDKGEYVLASAIDVSDRRRMELAATELREELVHLSRVAMLGELSGSLAHELNQPLAAILSNAQAAQRFLEQDAVHLAEVREILGDIVEDDKRAGEVIRRLRTLLKKDEVQFDALDVNDLAQEVLKLMRSDLLNRGVAVSTVLAPALPPVSGDRVQLQQVLLNLLINACDAMDHGAREGKQIVVRSAPAGSVVEVSIADRGRGIPLGELERIFEPFVTTKAQGLGLGLAVCRTIVAAHGGRIWASNNAGGGATIHFTLPS